MTASEETRSAPQHRAPGLPSGTLRWALGLCLAALPVLVHAAAPAEAAPAGDYADPKAVIAAAHRQIDDELMKASLSPFTAIDAHYLDAGTTARIGAAETKAVFDPPSPLPVMGAVSFEEGTFYVAPVSGAKPPVVLAMKDGDVVPGGGAPVERKTKLGDDEVVGVGRFLLSMSPQSGTGRVMVYDPASDMKKAFRGLKWFPPNLDLRVTATFKPDPAPKKLTVGTSRGLKKEFYRAGTFEFEVEGSAQHLAVLAGSAEPKEGDDLFIPFRDATTGKESYDVGRYLNMKFKAPGSTYLIDFNDAGNPNCNYSPWYNCPIPPAENTLTVPIRAGEMTYPGHP